MDTSAGGLRDHSFQSAHKYMDQKINLGPTLNFGARKPTEKGLLDGTRVGGALTTDLRAQMTRLILSPAEPVSLHAPQANTPHFSRVLPTFVTLMTRIRAELESNVTKLLTLNPSRREAIAQHLEQLAGIAPSPSHAVGLADAAGGLRRWIDGPRSPAQNRALQGYFEELARILLGQAILLKAWSDRGLRPWKEEDLGRLNWSLNSALKPQVPLDREGWQITRPNLYSWYNPSPALQREIWNTLQEWRITDEGPSLLAALLRVSSHGQSHRLNYDERFFSSIWEHLSSFGFSSQPGDDTLRRRKTVFTPTLRDGTLVRTGPASINWLGVEGNLFQLLAAELVQLWWGPAAPPLWAHGLGLEVHPRDQLTLGLCSPKPSLVSRIAEMEACDLAFVLEENSIRLNQRNAEAQRVKKTLEVLPYFKRLKHAATSLGTLQACVAMSKLRPGGLMLWTREEPISEEEGKDALGFILDRGKLICEWNLSSLSHSLPSANSLFPKFIYLVSRETNMQERVSHRPMRVSTQGQIRSHVEVPLVLAESLQSIYRGSSQARTQWQVHVYQSPNTQKDWAERWPNAAGADTISALEELRTNSSPLASVTTVRSTPPGDPAKGGRWLVPPYMKGFWIRTEMKSEQCHLVCDPLPCLGREAQGAGYLVLVSDETWIAPLMHYFLSPKVKNWLDHHAERRGERWVLSEQILKFLPIPKSLLRALGAPVDPDGAQTSEPSFARPLPGEWEKLASDVAYTPELVNHKLQTLDQSNASRDIRASLFVRTARAYEQLTQGQGKLLSMVGDQGQIRWRELLSVLPKAELVPISIHTGLRLAGTLPPHLPIGRIDRVKSPMPGILLSTESGFNIHMGSHQSMLLEMLWEQMDGLVHPTWNELVQYLKLPRNLEMAEATASDILRSHGEMSGRLKEMLKILSNCSDL